VETIGEIPADYLASISDGLWTEPIAVQVKPHAAGRIATI
jgi:hypothetical protein